MNAGAHMPVMRAEALEALRPINGGSYLDGTFGAGGHSAAILDAADCTVWAIDRDPAAEARAASLLENHPGRLTVILGRFGDMAELMAAHGVSTVNGILLDLGVSSMQLDEPARGFSFRTDGPLDMRMGRTGETAADLVNALSEEELADILYIYGEERAARRIARAIVAARRERAFSRTGELADLVRNLAPARRASGIDPATRTFQALRIAVNDEIGELRRALAAAEALLSPGGRLVVISFHSLEDREVKSFLRDASGRTPGASRHAPARTETTRPTFTLLRNGATKPSAAEIKVNPRARSARLRAAERSDAPARHFPPNAGDVPAGRAKEA